MASGPITSWQVDGETDQVLTAHRHTHTQEAGLLNHPPDSSLPGFGNPIIPRFKYHDSINLNGMRTSQIQHEFFTLSFHI